MIRYSLIFALAALPAMAQAQQTDVMSDISALVDARSAESAKTARKLWEWAEVGYQEQKSSGLLQQSLKANGFKITDGVADIPTAFTAEFGSGGPIIAILAEFDALPGINQDAVATRTPIEGKGAAHACGHNLFGAGSVEAAIAVSKWLKQTGTPGRVRLYGTPAEEGGSGKVYMVRAGLFDDVDFALHWHAGDENSAAARTTLANRSAKFRFRGTSAHAAGAPDKARSALDGVEAFNMMINMMREHVPQESRIHYVITEGGTAPNVVPDFAEVFYYVRHPDPTGVDAIWTRLEEAARGAALGTGTKVDWEVIHGNNPLLVNESLAKMMDAKLRKVGGIQYTPAEQEFAENIYASFDKPNNKLGSEKEIQPYEKSLGYGSTDVGDVSYATPTVGLRTATWVPGTSAHSWQSSAASGMSIGFKGTQVAAKTLALAAIELYTNPELRAKAKAEFDDARGPDYKYKSLLGDRDPPLDYRK
ncbi:amidohydrolase [Parasphingorhabdus flavimaris]|uniref:Amidohydrolase n=1 Tax=Parasphingorhabdus flavimaris TaxID=266812 RepID=A0ABX2N4K1_9SPHN|nr:amidohydrolase [Parasphingorhabdus flavimaris]NVD28655.1 amidohydrolase [Parasphingorhabdus flavimaris]